MALFITRVELHGNPTWQDYDRLHQAMGAQGFSRTITGQDGIENHLPHAEYYLNAQLTFTQVLNKAKFAASQVWNDFGILVSEATNITWIGLAPV